MREFLLEATFLSYVELDWTITYIPVIFFALSHLHKLISATVHKIQCKGPIWRGILVIKIIKHIFSFQMLYFFFSFLLLRQDDVLFRSFFLQKIRFERFILD